MKYFSPGKLMLTGEYVVLNGAKALSIPTGKYGQSLEITPHEQPYYLWQSYEPGSLWFEARFSPDFSGILHTNDNDVALVLLRLLQYIQTKKPKLFTQNLYFKSELNFNRYWGLGSSSTLIANLAKWAKINPFALLSISFGGSGYDVAVGLEQKPLIYQLQKKDTDMAPFRYGKYFPIWHSIDFNPPFAGEVFLVYLNQKQNSQAEVKAYKNTSPSEKTIAEINHITEQLSLATELTDFEKLLNRHEEILSKILQRPAIKESLFPDYPGTIKSLGAWGGDFVLATGNRKYFEDKGFDTILELTEILRA